MKENRLTLIKIIFAIIILAIIALVIIIIVNNKVNIAKLSAAEAESKKIVNMIESQCTIFRLTDRLNKTNEDICKDGVTVLEVASMVELNETTIDELEVTYGYVAKLVITKDGKTVSYDNSNIIIDASALGYKCKRASTLHTEICSQTEESCIAAGYTSGSKITYGSLGTIGILTSGDAFDCDVNGDGNYDAETERFYYVSGLDGNDTSSTAVLIYYNNVNNGKSNNSTTLSYNTKYSKTKYYGPQTAIKELPSITQWTNINLTNNKRNITDETGKVRISNFGYVGYSARLLTVQEVNTTCGITINSWKKGELDSCNYLMENTKYTSDSMKTQGYWLETPDGDNFSFAWGVYGYGSFGNNAATRLSNFYGVRPAIEVLKAYILY